jgi:long-chain acyl-CoA synthetase
MSVNQRPSPPDRGNHSTALEDCGDPVAALLAAYRAGGLISLRTSGTTGQPRRVIRTAASWVDSFPIVAEWINLRPGSRAWIPGPLSSTMNLYAAALASHCGADLVAAAGSATHGFLTPAGLIKLLEQDAPSGLRIVVAGDRLASALADRAEERGWQVSHYYGAAQLSFVAWGRDAASLRPFPGVEVRARDGELWVSSPWLCEREVTPSGMAPSMAAYADRDGRRWASVGDRGSMTADGRVVITGRDDAIITGGATVTVSELEAVLRPEARGEVFLVPQRHDRLGSIVVAVCTEADDLELLPRHARTVLDRAQRPARWLHLPTLPITAAGKVDRGALAAMASRV